MEIKAQANQLVWEPLEYNNLMVGHKTDFVANLGVLKIYVRQLRRQEFDVFLNNVGRISPQSYSTENEAKQYAQQWADNLAASIAKPFVVPDKLGSYDDDCNSWNNCREETLRLNGVKE